MGLDSKSICTFNDLGEAFVKQYKYNMNMAPDRVSVWTGYVQGNDSTCASNDS